MRVEELTAQAILVELTGDDMKKLRITYEQMDGADVETRRVIWTILDRVRHALRRDIDPSSRMTIESVPTAEGGCVLFFTVPPLSENGVRQVLHIRREAANLVCMIETADALLRCAERMRERGEPLPESRLYLWQDRYVLLVQNDARAAVSRMILAEYGTLYPESALPAAALNEHGKLLAENGALEKLTPES